MKKLLTLASAALLALSPSVAHAGTSYSFFVLPAWLTGGPPPPGYCVGYTYGMPFLVKC